MGNTKLDPRSLTSEERVVVEEMVTRTGTDSGYVFTGDNAQFVGWHVEVEYAEAYAAAFQRILARRAIFGEPASEGGKVETYLCPNCGMPCKMEDHHEGGKYTCRGRKPAQPEPEFKTCPHCRQLTQTPHFDLEAARNAIALLRSFGSAKPLCQSAAAALESFCRAHAAQPAPAVAMTPALGKVLESAEFAGKHYDDWGVLSAVAAVRQEVTQAAEAGKVRMPKVREFLEREQSMYKNPDGERLLNAALAELNAAEGRK